MRRKWKLSSSSSLTRARQHTTPSAVPDVSARVHPQAGHARQGCLLVGSLCARSSAGMVWFLFFSPRFPHPRAFLEQSFPDPCTHSRARTHTQTCTHSLFSSLCGVPAMDCRMLVNLQPCGERSIAFQMIPDRFSSMEELIAHLAASVMRLLSLFFCSLSLSLSWVSFFC